MTTAMAIFENQDRAHARTKEAIWNARKAALTPRSTGLSVKTRTYQPASKQRASRKAEPGHEMMHLALIDAT
jgi:hypothetical protein